MKKLLIVLAAVALLLSACTINIGTGASTEAKDKEIASSYLPTEEAPEAPTEDPAEETSAFVDEEKVDEELNAVWAELNKLDGGVKFRHSWSDGNLFVDISCPPLDGYPEKMAASSADDRAAVVSYAHEYVSGSIGSSIYTIARTAGGEDFDVYITLYCSSGICCSSLNLKIFIDNINE